MRGPPQVPDVVPVDPVDELAIRALLIRYAAGIDTKDWALLRACFTDDCHVRYGGVAWHGADELTSAFAAAHARLDESMHRVLNIAVIAFAGDAARTRSYCDAILVRRGAPGGQVLQVSGVYADTLARLSSSWRIADREFRAVRCQGSFGVLGLDRDQSAPVYGDAVCEA
jgi:ketosteroid isomerase-like protein